MTTSCPAIRTLTFPAGSVAGATQSITLSMFDNFLPNPTRTINLALSQVESFALVPSSTGLTINIVDAPSDVTLVKKVFLDSEVGESTALFTPFQGKLYFEAEPIAPGQTTLWVSDGTPDGTMPVGNSPNGILPGVMAVAGDKLFITGYTQGLDGSDFSYGFYVYDGTTPEPVRLLSDYFPKELTAFDDQLYFFNIANGGTEYSLWTSDGTAAGTHLVKSFGNGAVDADPRNLTSVGSLLYFTTVDATTGGSDLWASDGTTAGTHLVQEFPNSVYSLTAINDDLYFDTYLYTAGGDHLVTQLWKSDAIHGPMLIDTFANDLNFSPGGFTDVNGTLFFDADDGVHGIELWKSDGTPDGTTMVTDLVDGPDGSYPISLTNAGGTLFFEAYDPAFGNELWKSDGTADGTVMVKDIHPGSERRAIGGSYRRRRLNGFLRRGRRNKRRGALDE